MDEDHSRCTIEPHPADEHFPAWLEASLVDGAANQLLVLYPNEASRKQALNVLSGHGLSVDTTHHLTLPRLVDLLHLDLKQPRKLVDGPGLFSVVHELTKRAAERGDLPLLFTPTNESRVWLPYNTERLLSLHAGLMDLDHPWRWEEDPGAREFHTILTEAGRLLEGTHPALIQRNLVVALDKMPTPFTLNDVKGILILDTAPDYTESEISFLRAVSRHRPIHHLCNPGSFRLGFHGAYIDDVPYVTEKTLPHWIPKHAIAHPSLPTTPRASTGPELRRIQLHQREHAMDSTLELIRSYKSTQTGSVLIIDGQAQARRAMWRTRLSEIGIEMARPPEALNTVPGIHHLIRLARLTHGSNAWSMGHLRDLTSHHSLGLINGGVTNLSHPIHDTWTPRPHLDVLEGMARSFHVRGGPGALGRWIRTMANAQPQLGRDSDAARQALEETQWWLASLARLWAPFVEGEDRHLLQERVQGCSTDATLPMPEACLSGAEWLNHILSQLNWDELIGRMAAYDQTVPALQLMSAAHAGAKELFEKASMSLPSNGAAFVELLERLVSGTKLPSQRTSSTDIQVLTPEEAHGVNAELVLLVGVDVDSWSMKTSKIPWLDAPTKLKLGMLHTDLAVRKGRHHLNHLLHAGEIVIIFDSTLEEGGGPAAPLAEWLSDAQSNGLYSTLQGAPSFLTEEELIGDHPSRAWQFESTTTDENWLTPRPFTIESVDGAVSGIRSGYRHRDARQRLGLALKENRPTQGDVNAIHGIAMGFEASIANDRIQRQPSFDDLEKGEYMPWGAHAHLVTTDPLILRPSMTQAKVGSKSQPQWPHLGFKKNGNSRGVSIDPRPLPPPQFEGDVISEIFGLQAGGVQREVWSASRIQPWLSCPRQAWVDGHLSAQDAEDELEDIDHRTRGQIIHDAEAALLAAHGVPIGGEVLASSTSLARGACSTPEQGWQAVLAHLEEHVPWLSRNDAIATHRCRDLVGVSPSDWQAHIAGEQSIEPAGRLWHMVQADYTVLDAAPIACEWPVSTETSTSVEIDASNDEENVAPFRVRGNVDRVDEVILGSDARAAAVAAGLLTDDDCATPIDLCDPSSSPPARRWVIIRDLKTVNGPKKGESGLRHLRALFEEIQLAIYARAWERAHPGDRVVGVGVMEVGETSTHYVELDPEIVPYLTGLTLGERTGVVSQQFRFVSDESYESNGFRAWMYQRLQTARRAIDVAGSGQVHPVPGAGCTFCKVRTVCPSSIHGGELR